MKKTPNHLIYLLVTAAFLLSLAGCSLMETAEVDRSAAYAVEDRIVSLEAENKILKDKNVELKEELATQQSLSADLQMAALVMHAENNKLQLRYEKLLQDYVKIQAKLRTRSRNSKVETVSLLADVTAVVESAKDNSSKIYSDESIKEAEKFLAKSKIELDSENYEGASYLARQALETISWIQDSGAREKAAKEIDFFAPLAMKLTDNANFRVSPSFEAKILSVLPANEIVTATGYKDLWVKVISGKGNKGWVYYSLLCGACD